MAKSDHGLPARSGATQRCITREEEELRWWYATQPMTFAEYTRRMKALKRKGLVRR